ncbi:hypothetical protein OAC89_04715 [Deltaproteobacteria bacterium]|nr:hypothetical protein [Deltaproteobacteria bacterium]
MNRVSEKLSSLYLTTWVLVILLLWVGWGILMAGSDAFTEGFNEMNGTLIRDWLISSETGFPLLKAWFVGLCLLMTVIGINLIFCSWAKIYRIVRAKFNGPKLFMLFVHVLFGFVALGHLGGLMLGYEHNGIRLWEGNRFTFEDGYSLEVAGVHFVDDYEILKKSGRDTTRNEFDYTKNFAEIVLSRKDKEVSRDKIYMFRPMDYKGIQITLRSFISSPGMDNNTTAGDGVKPGLLLTVSRNPVLDIFMVLYPMMIAGIFVHLILTWRSTSVPKNNVG